MNASRIVMLVSSVLALLAVGVGLWAVGSPEDARRQRMDALRVQHLGALAEAVDRYWTRNGALPETLKDVESLSADKISDGDPETAIPYGYRRLEKGRFALCATFSLDDPDGVRDATSRAAAPRRWDHPAGETCFDLEARRLDTPGTGMLTPESGTATR